MTTKNSSLRRLRAQAAEIAHVMKQAEAGIARDTRILEARCTKPNFKTGIVMDDKVITLDIPWTTIAETEKAALAEYVLGLMRESRAVLN